MPAKLVIPIVVAMLILAGCTPQIQMPTKVCPGKPSVDEALAALQAQSQNAVPLKAHGKSRLEFYAEEKKKPQKENLDVKLRVNPPAEIYLQGDKSILAKAFMLGSNEEAFWLSIKPKISVHIWGKWAEQDSAGGRVINPRNMLEALGIGQIVSEQDWSLSNEGAYDILTERERGVATKKIHIWCCDYRTRKIELFDSEGQAVATTVLDKYEEVSEGFFVPTLLRITTLARDETEKPFTITINLASIRPSKEFKKWPALLFERPKRIGGFKKIYRMINGKLIEQPK
ncbi:MAG: hypothetical protein JSW59_16375 [Phycisphaerales bacterium]|nr:MAG: hypothetical protein JSW59_16375 [Phycisphaerales bacterium]